VIVTLSTLARPRIVPYRGRWNRFPAPPCTALNEEKT
jgi:hypothetical protein